MVFKGPKAILASHLSKSLSEYADVDPSAIETNLLVSSDTKIVLNHVQLRPQKLPLRPSDSSGEATMATISGMIEEIAFTWSWFSSSNNRSSSNSSASANNAWIKDSTLTIQGLKIKAQIAYCTDEEYTAALSPETAEDAEELSTENNLDEIERAGGIKAYIEMQLQRILDSLTLNLTDFEITVELPPTIVVATTSQKKKKKQTGVQEDVVSSESGTKDDKGATKSTSTPQQFSIVVRGTNVKLISLGEKQLGRDEYSQESQSDNNSSSPLKQQLSIDSFQANVVAGNLNDAGDTTYPLIEPFGYSVIVNRYSGIRFLSSMETGLEVIGQPTTPAVPSSDQGELNDNNNGLVFHAGSIQIQALMYLEEVFSSASSPSSTSPGTVTPAQEQDPVSSLPPHSTKHAPSSSQASNASHIAFFACTIVATTLLASHRSKAVQGGSLILLVGMIFYHETIMKLPICRRRRQDARTRSSTIQLPISSVALVLPNATKVTVTMITIMYRADGTVLHIEGAQGSGILVDDYTLAEMIECDNLTRGRWVVDLMAYSFLIEDHSSVLLTEVQKGRKSDESEKRSSASPMAVVHYHPVIVNKLVAGMSDLTLYYDADETEASQDYSSSVVIRGCIHILQMEEGSTADSVKVNDVVLLRDLDLELVQKNSFQQVIFHLGEVRNKLLHVQKIYTTGLIPTGCTDELRSLTFETESVSVTAGYTPDDWSKMIMIGVDEEGGQQPQMGDQPETTDTTPKKSDTPKKPSQPTILKLPFAYIAALKLQISYRSKVVSATTTSINIQQFVGGPGTTSEDLIRYYSEAVLSRIPGFLTNTEVLGVNVADTTVSYFGVSKGGAAGGVGAIAAYDAVKSAVATGKKSREATSEDRYKPGDFTRGVIGATKEATRRGRESRENGDNSGDDEELSREVEDFLVGTASTVEDYAEENKSRLGAAGAAGVAKAAGTAVAGPVGGALAGVALGAITGKVIEKFEENDDDDEPEGSSSGSGHGSA